MHALKSSATLNRLATSPAAIAELERRINDGERDIVLLDLRRVPANRRRRPG